MITAPFPSLSVPLPSLETHTLSGFIRLYPGRTDTPGFAIPVFGNAFRPLLQISDGEGRIAEFSRCTFPAVASFPARAQFQRSVGDLLLQAFHFPGETPFAGEESEMNAYLKKRISALSPFPSVKLSILRRLQIAEGYMETVERLAETMRERDSAAARSWLLEERQVFEMLVKSGELR